ncbi:MAG: glycogen debranching protein GlgX [Actinomycetota bacterium]|nr:glycogen debranching protein GlgX [Actinomycetota bacterium]
MASARSGSHRRLGASWDGRGTNVALWAPTATAVDVCLFDEVGVESRVRLPESTDEIWHGYLSGVRPGQRYGLRLHGPQHSPARLLLDPYAKAVDGSFDPAGPSPHGDTAPHVPCGVVVDEHFDWAGDRAPDVPLGETVVYETHVGSLTRAHPDVPEQLRGTYAGLAHPAVTSYLRDLGVTSVELLPVHHFLSEPRLTARGSTNHWGYNTLAFFAPHGPYAASGTRGHQVTEFKAMVRALHAAGLEVLLDVVYNHTAEGEPDGPTLSLRGIDAAAYYRHHPQGSSRYDDVTGCGNTLQTSYGPGLRLVMDSLRYWVEQMHVDGFRFDLAPALARTSGPYDVRSPLLAAIAQDPTLRRVKLIAEPWDLGPGGYQVGHFPVGWSEWNDKYRDSVRDFWRGHSDGVRELGYRLTGSSDLFRAAGRRPTASVNFVTAHDGFTLRDLVSYDRKHNEANGEGNADGTDDNRSWNCGVEGPAGIEVERLRRRQARNLLTTLLLSAGVPMLLAGDERWRTQGGNNNAYCLDLGLDWSAPGGDDLAEWVRALLRLRAGHAVLRPVHFLDGQQLPGRGGVRDLAWFAADGSPMTEPQWHDSGQRTLGMYLDGRAMGHRVRLGPSASFLLWLHAGPADTTVCLPGSSWGLRYDVVLDTTLELPVPGTAGLGAGAALPVTARSALLVQCHHHYSAGRSGR